MISKHASLEAGGTSGADDKPPGLVLVLDDEPLLLRDLERILKAHRQLEKTSRRRSPG